MSLMYYSGYSNEMCQLKGKSGHLKSQWEQETQKRGDAYYWVLLPAPHCTTMGQT